MELQDGHLKAIARSIRRGRCVPFLGAAVNVTCHDYDGLPLGYEVAESLATNFRYEIADKKNLPRVSLIHERVVKRVNLVDDLRGMLPDHQREPSRILTTLAEMPIDLYITTNYDRLLERALSKSGREPIVVVQTTTVLENRAGLDEWIDGEEGSRRPLVYKIHGTFREPQRDRDDDSPLIITEDDYIDFLILLGSKEHGVPKVIADRLKNDTLLFLGYSLEDWDFRALYKIIMKSYEGHRFTQPRFSVQVKPPQYWMGFWAEQKVDILEADVYEFIDQLKAAYLALQEGGVNAVP